MKDMLNLKRRRQLLSFAQIDSLKEEFNKALENGAELVENISPSSVSSTS